MCYTATADLRPAAAVDDIARILASGANVVSSSLVQLLHPATADRSMVERLEAAPRFWGCSGRGPRGPATPAIAWPVIPTALVAACATGGDLLRRLGDLDGAEASYRRASEHGRDPQPGLALLRLAQGCVDAGDAAIRRVLGEAEDPISRVRLLGPYVEIVLAVGDTAAARVAAHELGETAARLGTPLLRAQAARAAAAVLLADSDAKAALVHRVGSPAHLQDRGEQLDLLGASAATRMPPGKVSSTCGFGSRRNRARSRERGRSTTGKTPQSGCDTSWSHSSW